MKKPEPAFQSQTDPKRRDAIATRQRLLEAAGHEFVIHGFHDASVRAICRRAEANVSAIRHYFGSKEALYREVLVAVHRELLQRRPPPEFSKGDDPVEVLGHWFEFTLRVFLVRRTAYPAAFQLFIRELQAPTEALGELIQLILPIRLGLESIIGALLGEADSPTLRGQCANYVLGMIIINELGREALTRFGYPPPQCEEDIPAFSRRMLPFALGGIERVRAEAARHQGGPPG